ncbi:hypothetical protein LUZ60_014570 [Juncus effusus]|nr:hypothetical protein LUZ60_014570 [Juncus effusus]
MALLSANPLSQKTAPAPVPSSFINPNLIPSISFPYSFSPKNSSLIVSSSSSATSTTTSIAMEDKSSTSSWAEFAKRVSGEWDGHGADFSIEGKPIELPEQVVPEAYREWGVQVFDWQTQCPTLAEESGEPILYCKLVKFYPTVGCEADAATQYSVERRFAGGPENSAAVLAYSSTGSYVASWPFKGQNGKNTIQLEHCLIDPTNTEFRVRVIQMINQGKDGLMNLGGLRVFSEQRYGPFCDGEQLGACAVRESGFASTSALDGSKVLGIWKGESCSIARFEDSIFSEFLMVAPQEDLTRDEIGLVTLPKQLWSQNKELDSDHILMEVGWLISENNAITSRCVLSKDGKLKAMTLACENAVRET